jgi:hypothetical protein
MPCWTIQKNLLDMGKLDRPLAVLALESMGHTVMSAGQGFYSTGKTGESILMDDAGKATAITYGNDRVTEEFANRFRVAYSTAAVQTAARRFGWTITEKPGSPKTGAKKAFVAARRF